MPVSGTYLNASLFSARKTVKEAKYPVFRPIVWHVDAYERFSSERRVSAHPKNAVSSSLVQ